MAYLTGAIVQKIERPAPDAVLVSIRLPGRSAHVLVIAGAIGEIDKPRTRIAADAQIQRLRRALEGGRVVGVFAREDGARLVVAQGEERRALIATTRGVAFVERAEDDGEALAEDERARLAARAEQRLEEHLAALFDARRRAVVAAIESARKKLRKRLEAVAGDLQKIARADEWQRQGTLLIGNQHAVKRGAATVTLDDWSSGEAVPTTIPLDPSKDARGNADALFHRARRLKKGHAIADARRAETERAIAALDSLVADARAASDAPALDVIEARARAAGVRVTPPAAKKRDAEEERKPFHTFRSGERDILVGRGARDNDALTTKVARPNDLWLHAKGWTGAHVIVPLGKNESCPSDVLIDAAHLAAHFSDARGETIVEVQYTPRKYVRKPKGSAPGAVIVDREKVLVLRVEPSRITRLTQH